MTIGKTAPAPLSEPSEVERQRFWNSVRIVVDEGCWPWMAARSTAGYGAFHVGDRVVGAHRVAWTLAHGAVPDGLCVLHRCDVPLCVRPSHLFLGTHADNMRDKVAKGRACNNYTRLTEAEVNEIARILADGELTHNEIAHCFGVARATIGMISRGETWKHLTQEALR